eukprot:1143106-Pelagomonas_calceolata.AAC.5
MDKILNVLHPHSSMVGVLSLILHICDMASEPLKSSTAPECPAPLIALLSLDVQHHMDRCCEGVDDHEVAGVAGADADSAKVHDLHRISRQQRGMVMHLWCQR